MQYRNILKSTLKRLSSGVSRLQQFYEMKTSCRTVGTAIPVWLGKKIGKERKRKKKKMTCECLCVCKKKKKKSKIPGYLEGNPENC